MAAIVAFAAVTPSVVQAGQSSSGQFSNPLNIDADYFPLRPGTRFVYDGVVNDVDGAHAHRVIFTVTDLIKTIGGVNTRVIWDQDISDGELAEAELAFFAQDTAENVWTLGEYPEEYENGVFVGAPSTWISGVARARGGILVPGEPKTGTPAFDQGVAPAIDFYDVGKVIKTGQRVCVPAGCFSNVVVIDEWSPLAPEDGHQQKYYAPNVGLVRIDANSGDSQEVLTLTKIERLGYSGMKTARTAALRLDTRAYKYAWVYRGTEPAHR